MCWVCNLNQIDCNHHGGSHYILNESNKISNNLRKLYAHPKLSIPTEVQLIRAPAIVGNGRPEAQILNISPFGETVRFSRPNVDLKVQGLRCELRGLYRPYEWQGLDLQRRRDFALEGFYRGACGAFRDNSRVMCPELTIDNLVGDGEYNLINLLKKIMKHDPTGNRRVKELFLFPHHIVDKEFAATQDMPTTVRALLRPWRVFDAPADTGKDPSLRTEERAEAYRIMEEADKKCPVDQSQCKEQAAICTSACHCCRIATGRGNLMRCGKCEIVGYYSRTCQKSDWPVHKKVCGRQTFDPQAIAPISQAPDEFIGCPAAVPGFVRTPALSANMTFLVARRRAMASGSIPAIHMMLRILLYQEKHQGCIFGYDRMRRQFEIEYGVEITPESMAAAEPFGKPTIQELKEEASFLEQRLARVPP
ncbi:hypothetical protein B0H16DRAFT_1694889 [Mycena metata]|uniref:MYND-type domain-containing protein n=1 Tax=Mycena metata TaxID=1033252 RepID=A0AAD7IA10_9AGAR|nr:hypothetical protein B0H16DRAFT_1694889 [Mycena metata]